VEPVSKLADVGFTSIETNVMAVVVWVGIISGTVDVGTNAVPVTIVTIGLDADEHPADTTRSDNRQNIVTMNNLVFNSILLDIRGSYLLS
jgi:hypothetical protein